MLYRMLRAFDGFFGVFRYLWSPLIFLMRVHWGWLFFVTGYGKLMSISSTATFFASLHIPFPEYMAYLVGIVETVGGLCLLLGFLSRLVSFPLFVTMIVALFTAHLGGVMGVGAGTMDWFSNLFSLSFVGVTPFSSLVNEQPFFYMVTTLLVLMGGPGYFSLDKLMRSRVER